MSEIRRLMQAGAVMAERCDNLNDNRYTFEGGSAGDITQINSPYGPAFYFTAARSVKLIDARIASLQTKTEFTLCVWYMWSGADVAVASGIITIGNVFGMRKNHTGDLRTQRARYLDSAAASTLANTSVDMIAGEWNFGASVVDGPNLLLRSYMNGASGTTALPANNPPATFTDNSVEIGEEWGGANWSGGIAAVAVFDRVLSVTELDNFYYGKAF